jgi:TolB protein
VRVPLALRLSLALLPAVVVAAGSAAAGPGLIAYSSNGTPLFADHIFAYTPGGAAKMLGEGVFPVWSPDGSRVAFLRDSQLYVMNADGGGVRQLTSGDKINSYSEYAGWSDPPIGWSPDGTRIDYVDSGATVVLDLASGAKTSFPGVTLRWSPDGSRVAYEPGTKPASIVVSSADGSSPVTVASAESVGSVAWSPDSQRLAYITYTGNRGTLAVVQADGTGATTLASGRSYLRCVSWSPHTGEVVYVSNPSESVYEAKPDGSGSALLTTHKTDIMSCPAWAPDGRELALLVLMPPGDSRAALTVVPIPGGKERTLAVAGVGTSLAGDIWDESWSPDGKQIAVASSGQVLLVPLSGGPLVRSARSDPRLYFSNLPAWSPHARTVLFSAHAEWNDLEIWVSSPDGTGAHPLTDNPYRDSYPSWSPDGTKIVFVRSGAGAKGDGIWVMNADGSAAHRITPEQGAESTPEWSPDGRTIAFVWESELWLMNADGSHQHRIVPAPVNAGIVSWSPDGSRIAYGNGSIWVVDSDGGHRHRVTNGPRDSSPAWSPDGSEIAFTSSPRFSYEQTGDYTLSTVHPDGSGLHQLLVSTTGQMAHPAWSPDGGRIVFDSNDSLYTVNADGTSVAPILPSLGFEFQPAWSP